MKYCSINDVNTSKDAILASRSDNPIIRDYAHAMIKGDMATMKSIEDYLSLRHYMNIPLTDVEWELIEQQRREES